MSEIIIRVGKSMGLSLLIVIALISGIKCIFYTLDVEIDYIGKIFIGILCVLAYIIIGSELFTEVFKKETKSKYYY